MTWSSFHQRGAILRTVIATADVRRDGFLPMDVEGAAETFGDELALLGALQLRWHTRLGGRIERELMSQPLDLEQAVLTAWRDTASELPGVLAILDRHRAEPLDAPMAEAMTKSATKEWILMAVMAGLASAQDASAARVGEQIEHSARATHRAVSHAATRTATHTGAEDDDPGLLERIKSVLAA